MTILSLTMYALIFSEIFLYWIFFPNLSLIDHTRSLNPSICLIKTVEENLGFISNILGPAFVNISCIFILPVNLNSTAIFRHRSEICLFSIILILYPNYTVIDRIGYYLIALQIFVFTFLPGVFGNPLKKNKFWVISVISYYFLVLFFWQNFADHNYAWIPYKSYIFNLNW